MIWKFPWRVASCENCCGERAADGGCRTGTSLVGSTTASASGPEDGSFCDWMTAAGAANGRVSTARCARSAKSVSMPGNSRGVLVPLRPDIWDDTEVVPPLDGGGARK